MKKYVKLFESFQRTGGNDIYLAIIEAPGEEHIIALSDREGARKIADRFEQMFLDSLTFDSSEVVFDIFRTRPVDQEELEDMLNDVLGDYDSVGDVINDIRTNGSIVLMDKRDIARIAAETSDEY